jgi:hypothetical protein
MNSDRFQVQSAAGLWGSLLRGVLGAACFGGSTAWPIQHAWSDPPVLSGRPLLAPRLDTLTQSGQRPAEPTRPDLSHPASGGPLPRPPSPPQPRPALTAQTVGFGPRGPHEVLRGGLPQSHPDLGPSGVAGPHHYLVLDARPMPKHPLPPLNTGDTRQSVPNRPYAFGWFGARPAQNHWSRHFGATGQQLQWTRK